VFIPNAIEARQLTGAATTEAALRVLGGVCPLVVVKDGPRGAYALEHGRALHASALPVKVVDTTGAGDAFTAGFIRAWLDGRPTEECLCWGNICGGLSTTAVGGTAAAPTLREVEQWLARTTNDK
jgi:sugar/nucleoside kinase (ribokinase family)